MKARHLALSICILLFAAPAWTQELVIEMYRLTARGVGETIGTITAESSPYGVIFTPDLRGLPPGPHGFHVHENPSCEPGRENREMKPGLAAGGHYDPLQTESHVGPYGEGHLGDLPVLFVEEDGTATVPVAAPRLRLFDLYGRSLVIHEGGDTYADEPHLGGGGGRLACGVIEER